MSSVSSEHLVLRCYNENMLFRSYVKRLRMVASLADPGMAPILPEDCRWYSWYESDPEEHAELLYQVFCDSIDATIFPAFRTREGCDAVIENITRNSGFAPEASGVIRRGTEAVAAIQSMYADGQGEILNIVVLPGERRRGIGEGLMRQTMTTFRRAGCARVALDVCARNAAAVRFYLALGFQIRRTDYLETKPGREEYTI